MRRRWAVALLAVALFALVSLYGCASSKDSGTQTGDTTASTSASGSSATADSQTDGAYHLITSEDAKNLIDAGGVTIVDVRTASEYADGHIPGAINVPLDQIGDSKPEALPDLDAKLIVYCRTGVRSKQASDALVALGYTDVNDLSGGITAWPYETEK